MPSPERSALARLTPSIPPATTATTATTAAAANRKHHSRRAATGGMSPSVDDYRNEIRVAVGRHERLVSTTFTKEALAAVCTEVGGEVPDGTLPAKAAMRETIREHVADLDADPEAAARPFRKAELAAIAAALSDETA